MSNTVLQIDKVESEAMVGVFGPILSSLNIAPN